MRRRSLVLYFAFVLVGCGSSLPDDVIPPKKMQFVLWDMLRADELASYNVTHDSSFVFLPKHEAYYQQVFQVYHTGKEEFTRSLRYYENHPALMKVVLDSVQQIAERSQRVQMEKYGQSRDIPVPTPQMDSTLLDSFKRKKGLLRKH